jgi:hypothetical protein
MASASVAALTGEPDFGCVRSSTRGEMAILIRTDTPKKYAARRHLVGLPGLGAKPVCHRVRANHGAGRRIFYERCLILNIRKVRVCSFNPALMLKTSRTVLQQDPFMAIDLYLTDQKKETDETKKPKSRASRSMADESGALVNQACAQA